MDYALRQEYKMSLCWLFEASAENMESLISSVTSLNTSQARKAKSEENLSHWSVKRSTKKGKIPLVCCINLRKTAGRGLSGCDFP
jgi:hypothetical protein